MYSAILIDMFNLAYKKHTQMANHIDTANAVINYINGEVSSHLDTNGNLYLLFDSLPKSDMGIGKNFKYHPERRQIVSSYKNNRSHNPVVYNALLLLKKYYTYRGDKIKICISNSFEADDFVEDLLRIESKGEVALVTNDSDWSRYIDDRVCMIKTDFKKPYTKEDYFLEYGMVPTIASVTLRKAIFGDITDNIPSSFTKKIRASKEVVMSYISQIAKDGTSLDDIKYAMQHTTYQHVMGSHGKTPIQEILIILGVDDDAMDIFNNNLRVVECRCKDSLKYTSSQPENRSYNNLMDTTLGRTASATKQFFFGAKVGRSRKKTT